MDELPAVERRADPLADALRRYLLNGDSGAMEAIVAATRPRLLAAARRIGRPADAEDSVQAAYLSLVRRRGRELEAPLLPWLLTATVREAYRRKAVHSRESRLASLLARAPDAADDPLADLMSAEEAARVRDDLARLPARWRDPLILRYFQGLSTAEIALLVGATDEAVRVRLHRARALLRRRWATGFVLAAVAVPFRLADAARASSIGSSAMGGAMGKGTMVASCAVVAAAGAFVGAKYLSPAQPDLDAVRREAAAPLRAEVGRLHEEARATQASLQFERARKADAERRAAELGALADAAKRREDARAADAATSVVAATKPGAARFAFAEYDDVLRGVDWAAVGKDLAAIPALLRELGDASDRRQPPDLALVAKLQTHRASLAKAAASAAEKARAVGRGGAFVRPAFMANAIAAALEEAKLPLDAAQAEALERLGRDFESRDASRVAGYDRRTWELRKEIDEAALQDAFFDATLALLRDDQRGALTLSGTRGMVALDPYSSGAMWAQFLRAVTFTSREHLIAQIADELRTRLAVADDRLADVRGVATQWVDALPVEWMQTSPHRVFGQPLVSVRRMADAAERNVTLLERVVEILGTKEAAELARAETSVLVPLYQKP